jgi:hypothetical protein
MAYLCIVLSLCHLQLLLPLLLYALQLLSPETLLVLQLVFCCLQLLPQLPRCCCCLLGCNIGLLAVSLLAISSFLQLLLGPDKLLLHQLQVCFCFLAASCPASAPRKTPAQLQLQCKQNSVFGLYGRLACPRPINSCSTWHV